MCQRGINTTKRVAFEEGVLACFTWHVISVLSLLGGFSLKSRLPLFGCSVSSLMLFTSSSLPLPPKHWPRTYVCIHGLGCLSVHVERERERERDLCTFISHMISYDVTSFYVASGYLGAACTFPVMKPLCLPWNEASG